MEASEPKWLMKEELYSVQWIPADITLVTEIEKKMNSAR